jgi:hypothetical protein
MSRRKLPYAPNLSFLSLTVFEFSVNEKDYTNELGLDGDLGSYRFLQAHFHWDEKDTEGSEHTLNGRQ